MKKTLFVASLLVLVATAAMASNFRVADTIYLPAAGKLRGGNNSFFRTDVWISNLNTDQVAVNVAFAPSGGGNNAGVTGATRALDLALQPNERREIVDIMGDVFDATDDQVTFGQLIFFACRVGGNCTGANPNTADFRNISVEARIYTTTAEGSTFGQLIPGIPWYSYISTDAQLVGLNTAFVVGIRQNADYRTNIGLMNASQFSTTTLRVRLFNSLGVQQGADFNEPLPPLAHQQRSVANMFPGFSGSGAFVTIEQINVTPTDPNDPVCFNGCPGFLAYGSLLDNKSNDPTYLETQFTKSFSEDQATCIYAQAGKAPPPRATRR